MADEATGANTLRIVVEELKTAACGGPGPAMTLGVAVGDVLVAVGGEDVRGLDFEDTLDKVMDLDWPRKRYDI